MGECGPRQWRTNSNRLTHFTHELLNVVIERRMIFFCFQFSRSFHSLRALSFLVFLGQRSPNGEGRGGEQHSQPNNERIWNDRRIRNKEEITNWPNTDTRLCLWVTIKCPPPPSTPQQRKKERKKTKTTTPLPSIRQTIGQQKKNLPKPDFPQRRWEIPATKIWKTHTKKKGEQHPTLMS